MGDLAELTTILENGGWYNRFRNTIRGFNSNLGLPFKVSLYFWNLWNKTAAMPVDIQIWT